MAVSIGGGIVKDGLVFHLTQNSIMAYKGMPTTNLRTVRLNGMTGVTLTYIETENGWHKYSMSGTFTGGTYPYCMNITSNSFTGGVAYSSQCIIKTNVEYKFNYFGSTINYVNQPQTASGVMTVTQLSDGSRLIKREGFIYTSTTTQLGYLGTNPINNTTFNPATDFVWIKDGQIEQNNFCTPFAGDSATRATTGVFYDATGLNTITATNLIYNSDGTVSYDGTTGDHRCVINAGTELNALKGSSAITAEAWVYYTSYSGGTESYSVITNSGYPWVWLLENPSQTLRFRTFIGGSDVSATDTSTHALNTWYHVVGTYNGANHILYVNGVEKANRADTGVLGSPTYGAYIGTYQGTNYCMSGKIDDVKIYNVALTAKQVKQNFEAGRALYGI